MRTGLFEHLDDGVLFPQTELLAARHEDVAASPLAKLLDHIGAEKTPTAGYKDPSGAPKDH